MQQFHKAIYELAVCLRDCSPKDMELEELMSTFITVQEMHRFAKNFCLLQGVEKLALERMYEQLQQEIDRRNLQDVVSCVACIRIDNHGNFLEGRDRLKHDLQQIPFDDMMEIVDGILAQPLNDEQRKAILNLAYEIVLEE